MANRRHGRHAWLTAAGLLVTGACGTEPSGTLTVTVNAVPALTTEDRVVVEGTVTRAPASDTPIVLAIAGGSHTINDTVPPDGAFSLSVVLRPNAENQLAITASDGTGSISAPTVLIVFHDDTGPQVTTMVPTNRSTSVALNTPIEARFSEPLIASGPNPRILLTRNAEAVAGTSNLTDNNQRVTFTPDEPLEPMSVYEILFEGYTDEALNPAGSGQSACFITTDEGLAPQTVSDDQDTGNGGPSNAWTAGAPPGTLTPANFVSATLARVDTTLHGLVEFSTDRSYGRTGDDNAAAVFDIDLDQDPATGFVSLYDFIFGQIESVTSDLGSEVVIGVESFEQLGDSAYVGMWLSDSLTFDVLDVFRPGVCGRFFGFDTDVVLGANGDDGDFDFTVLGIAQSETGTHFDAGPEDGVFTVQLAEAIASPVYPMTVQPHQRGRLQTLRRFQWLPRWPGRRQ